jgi:hypothetical protein
MLDRAFLRRFFDQLDESSDEQLAAKIAQVEKAMRSFPKGSEALMDSRFVLRHLRRELFERQFKNAAR